MHIERILLATDFSPHARRAMGYAAELSSRLGAPLIVVSAYQIPVYPLPEGAIAPSGDTIAHIVERTTEDLEAEKAAARALGAQQVDGLVVQGPAAVEIVRVARERDVDLIVIGSHGRGGIVRAILGSTADRVMRTAHCPVMVVAHGD